MRIRKRDLQRLIREYLEDEPPVGTWILRLRSVVGEMDDYDFDTDLGGVSARRALMSVIKMLDRDRGGASAPSGGENVVRLDDFR